MDLDYFKYTTKARHDKAINTLLGILEGIAADNTVSISEWNLLGKWIEENKSLAGLHPYFEIYPVLAGAISDGILSDEEHHDLVWLCRNLRSTEYYNQITADIQRLHAIISTIASDGVVTETELENLSNWLAENEHLRKCWPYEEVDSIATSVMKDRWVDPVEQRNLIAYFNSFGAPELNFDKQQSTLKTLPGICAVNPEIIFQDRCFCFTGESKRATREELKTLAQEMGARVVNHVSPRVDYLVVGSNGNPCWAYACYGRKIEQTINLRQQGAQILIVHEIDFFDEIT